MVRNYWSEVARKRLSRRRVLAAYGGTALGASLLAACGGGDDGTPARKDTSGLLIPAVDETKNVKRGGALKDRAASDTATFDPMLSRSGSLNRNYNQFFRQKGGYLAPARGEIEGDLAESWEMSPDKLQLTVKLTSKAHFHPVPPVNGRGVDAQDVLASYERLKAIGVQRDQLANEINPSAPVVSMTAPDNRTVVIKFVEPISTVLYLFANWAAVNLFIVPKEAMDGSVLDLRRTICGTGPWYLSDYEPSTRYVYRRNPGFNQDPRNVPYIDSIEQPIITEYAAGLAQFKTGNLHRFAVRPEDILITKQDVPALEMLATDVKTNGNRFYFGYLPQSPFRDERVRQALSMTWDRDLFIDVFYNVSKYQAAGLPMETRWSSTLQADSWEGWWLDPQGKDFGPNAKYYQHDIGEAKKLLAAASHANGVDSNLRLAFIGGTTGDIQRFEVLQGMAEEAGFRPKIINTWNTPEYEQVRAWGSTGAGRFEGMTVAVWFTAGVEPANFVYQFFNSKGGNFYGFDSAGLGNNAGDPFMDELTKRMRVEFDEKKRMALVHELQRHDAKMRYFFSDPGGANGFTLAWPALRNREVWRVDGQRDDATLWLDQTKAPFRAS